MGLSCLSIESRCNFWLVFSPLLSFAFVLGFDIKKKTMGVLQSGFQVFWWGIMAKEEEDSKEEAVSKGEK
jgi:hypothetical protein